MGVPFDGERARELGRKGGKASAARRRVKRPTLDDLKQFPPLDSHEAARQRLERVFTWVATGVMTGPEATAAIRSVEAWLKLQASQVTEAELLELRQEVKAIKAELAKGRPLRMAG